MRADALRNREKLLRAAERLITARGATLEIDEIARAAGVGTGTVYRHFATKDDLVRAIVVGPVERLIADAGRLAHARDPGAEFFAYLERLIDEVIEKHYLMEVLSRSGPVNVGTSAELASRRARFNKAFGVLLTRAQRAGAVRRDVRLAEVVALINGAFPWLRRDGGDTASMKRLRALVVDALAPR